MKQKETHEHTGATLHPFDRLLGLLDGLPDVTSTKQSIIQTIPPLGIGAETWIVQTFRQKEKGDTVFLQHVVGDTATRLALPPEVAELIARQRERVTGKVRSKAAKRTAADRMARGIKPGFMR